MSNIENIRIILSRVLGVPIYDISSNTLFDDIPAWDSITSLRVLSALEVTLNIKIPLYQFLMVKTLKELEDLIMGITA